MMSSGTPPVSNWGNTGFINTNPDPRRLFWGWIEISHQLWAPLSDFFCSNWLKSSKRAAEFIADGVWIQENLTYIPGNKQSLLEQRTVRVEATSDDSRASKQDWRSLMFLCVSPSCRWMTSARDSAEFKTRVYSFGCSLFSSAEWHIWSSDNLWW